LGLSRRADDVYDDSDTISGTPQYISPEQIMGDEMDIRGDFYSLGATLYHLVSGRFCFEGNLEDMIKKHMTETPDSLKRVAPHVDESLGKIIKKLLAKKPEQRYQDADSLIDDLNKAKRSLATTTNKRHITVKNVPSTPNLDVGPVGKNTSISRSDKVKKKDPTLSILIAVGGTILIIGIIVLVSMSGEKPKSKSNVTSSPTTSPPPKETYSAEERKAMESPFFKKSLKRVGLEDGLKYSYYIGRFGNLSQMLKTAPAITGETYTPDIWSLRKANEDFGFLFEGYINIPKTSTYTFYLATDDGSRLYLDDDLIIDNDNTHGPEEEKKGTAILEKGYHKFRLEYFQARSGFDFKMLMETSGMTKRPISNKYYFREPSKK
jgi:serine/threonine protein kinase